MPMSLIGAQIRYIFRQVQDRKEKACFAFGAPPGQPVARWGSNPALAQLD